MAIALVVVITVLVVRPDGNGSSNAGGTGSDSEFASASDTGPVNIITADPTCNAWGRVYDDYLSATSASGWADRDTTIPATAWNAEQRAMYEAMGKARTEAANQAMNLAKKTPHRVMRELYMQFIAYSRLAVDSIQTYVSSDNNLSGATDGAASALANVCSAITVNSAPTIAPLLSAPAPPSHVAALGEPSEAQPFVGSGNPSCSEWGPLGAKFDNATAEWRTIDAKIPAAEWTPAQRAVNEAAAAVMSENANDMERLGRESGNPVFEDIAVLAAQYRRAFVLAIPNYRPADNYLSQSTLYLTEIIFWACKAAS